MELVKKSNFGCKGFRRGEFENFVSGEIVARPRGLGLCKLHNSQNVGGSVLCRLHKDMRFIEKR